MLSNNDKYNKVNNKQQQQQQPALSQSRHTSKSCASSCLFTCYETVKFRYQIGRRRGRETKDPINYANNDDNNDNDGGSSGDKFRKRRGGAPFWTACQRCEEMLQYIGVPVVRAKAEGEALCALLNQKGIVDAVISNDGDCLLFGAKVLYTKFSIDNLEQSRVMRYDADDIRAVVDDDDADKYDETRQTTERR